MGVMDAIMARLGYVNAKRSAAFKGADTGRLFSSWASNRNTEDSNLRGSLALMRARSREMARNHPYARRFIKLLSKYVVGPKGVTLQSKVKDPKGGMDNHANRLIEEAWADWSTRHASVCGQLTWTDVLNLFIRHMVTDGECLIRIVRGYENPYRFALQVIEPDHLDENLNQLNSNSVSASPGSELRMGVEYDRWGKPLAYHLLNRHPGDWTAAQGGGKYERIPASEIIHGYIKERASQSRGVPWFHAVMNRLNMLDGYEEAELVAARVSAAKMGIIIQQAGDEFQGDGKDSSGAPLIDAEPGTFDRLGPGEDLKMFSPEHPATSYPFFVKAILRGVACGLDISYHSLTSDLEAVNYSSGRIGLLDERDGYRMIQEWIINRLCRPVFEAWLEMALLTQKAPLPMSKLAKFNAPKWQPRGFDWVDPLKDQQANITSIEAGLSTRADVLAEEGKDLEEVFAQIAEEIKLAESLGLRFDVKPAPAGAPAADANEEKKPNAKD